MNESDFHTVALKDLSTDLKALTHAFEAHREELSVANAILSERYTVMYRDIQVIRSDQRVTLNNFKTDIQAVNKGLNKLTQANAILVNTIDQKIKLSIAEVKEEISDLYPTWIVIKRLAVITGTVVSVLLSIILWLFNNLM